MGALTPSAPAIKRPATAVCFSGLEDGLPGLKGESLFVAGAYGFSNWPHSPRAVDDVGEIGVGGGAFGKPLTLGWTSDSLSEPEGASSSHESAIVEVFWFGVGFLTLWEDLEWEDLESDRPPSDVSTSA